MGVSPSPVVSSIPWLHPRPASRPSRVPWRRFAPLTARLFSPVPPSPWTTATRKGGFVEPPPTRSDLSTLAGDRLLAVPTPAPRRRLPPRDRGSRPQARLVQRALCWRGSAGWPRPAAGDHTDPVGRHRTPGRRWRRRSRRRSPFTDETVTPPASASPWRTPRNAPSSPDETVTPPPMKR